MDLKKVLEMAIENEKRSYDWYLTQSMEAQDPESRLLFEQIAEEEKIHIKKLTERLKILKIMD